MTDYHIDHLANGITIVAVERPAIHQVLARLMVRVGSRYEQPGESGVSHFLEHLMFRGNEAFADADALNRAFESIGGMLDAHTGVEATDFEFVAHPRHWAAGLQHLAHFISGPTFADLEKERAVLLDELAYDYNEQNRQINPVILSAEQMWPEHSLGRCVGGLPETVGKLSEAQLRKHHHNYYRPGNMVLGVAGPVKPEEVLDRAARIFETLVPEPPPGASCQPPTAAPPLRPGGPHLCVVPDSGNQFHVQLSFPAPDYNHPDELATAMLGRILDDGPTSRLQRVIREERALVYHIAAGYTPYWDTGSFDVATSVRREQLESLLTHLLGELAAFREEGPLPDEWERARIRHLFDLDFERDSLAAQLDRFAWPFLYSSIRKEAEERERIADMNHDGLHALARRMFTPENLHLVVVGPVESGTRVWLEQTVARF